MAPKVIGHHDVALETESSYSDVCVIDAHAAVTLPTLDNGANTLGVVTNPTFALETASPSMTQT